MDAEEDLGTGSRRIHTDVRIIHVDFHFTREETDAADREARLFFGKRPFEKALKNLTEKPDSRQARRFLKAAKKNPALAEIIRVHAELYAANKHLQQLLDNYILGGHKIPK